MNGLPKYERTVFDFTVIGMGYLFMPVGLILAIIRIIGTHFKNYRKAVSYNLLYHVFLGGFAELMIFAVAQTISGAQTKNDFLYFSIGMVIILLLPAFIFAQAALRGRRRFEHLADQYLQLVMANGVRYIGDISQLTGQSESDVRRDLQYLKNHGLIDIGIVISEGGGTAGYERTAAQPYSPFGAPGGQPYPQPTNSLPRSQPPAARMLPKSVSCPSCGAQNTVAPDQPKSCDYCGTALSYH